MRQVRIYGRDEPLEVQDAEDLAAQIKEIARLEHGYATFQVNDVSGELASNMTIADMRENFDRIEVLAIKPYNEAA